MNILIIGGAGYQNSGDEALLRAAVQVCRDFSPTARLMLASNNPDVAADTLKGYQVDFVHSPRLAFFRADAHYGAADDVFKSRWAALRDALVKQDLENAKLALRDSPALDFIDRHGSLAFLSALCEADTVVLHGGGILTSPTRSRLWEHALTVEFARKLGKRVLLRSHQLGPYETQEDLQRIRTILECASYVSTRDSAQSSCEVSALPGGTRVVDQIDDALILRTDEAPLPTLARYGLERHGFISVGYRDSPTIGMTDEALTKTMEIVRHAHQLFGLPVALVPQGPFDLPSLRRLAASLDIPCQVIEPDDQFRDPMTIAAQSRLVIACPHHSLIFGLRGGAPILSPAMGHYYLFKNRGSMRFFGLEDYVIDLQADDYMSVAENRLMSILTLGDSLRHRIAYKVSELRAKAMANDLLFARQLVGDPLVA